MILRIDDTDVERNTEASLNSIFEALRWLDLGWDEQYRQSERLALHKEIAEAIFQKGLAYRDFTPPQAGEADKSGAQGTWLFNAGMRELSREESDRRAAAGEPFALRFRVPRDTVRSIRFTDASTASNPNPPPTSKTSRCCAATACPRTTWPPAPTTPTCASATSSAGRTTSPTPSSTS